MPSSISVVLGAGEDITPLKAGMLGENPVRGVRDRSRWGSRGADGVECEVSTGGVLAPDWLVGEYS